MYKYKYIEIKLKWGFAKHYLSNEYQTIINEQSKNGYRFVCSIPKEQRGYGNTVKMDLVFEKKI